MAITKDLIFIIELPLRDSFGILARLTAVSSILVNNMVTPEKFVHAHQ